MQSKLGTLLKLPPLHTHGFSKSHLQFGMKWPLIIHIFRIFIFFKFHAPYSRQNCLTRWASQYSKHLAPKLLPLPQRILNWLDSSINSYTAVTTLIKQRRARKNLLWKYCLVTISPEARTDHDNSLYKVPIRIHRRRTNHSQWKELQKATRQIGKMQIVGLRMGMGYRGIHSRCFEWLQFEPCY